MDIINIATIKIIRIRPSPFFTESFADHHAPNAFPAARVRPNFKSTLCVKKKNEQSWNSIDKYDKYLVHIDINKVESHEMIK